MALAIFRRDKYGDIHLEQWQIGSGMPSPYTDDVTEIVVNGPELEKVRAEISGIPMSSMPEVQWFGDHAKFIVANLNYTK